MTTTSSMSSSGMAPGVVSMQMGGGGSANLARVVSGVWPFLDGDGRTQLVDELVQQADLKANERHRPSMAMAALQTAAAIARPIPNVAALSTAAAGIPGYNPSANAARVIALAPAADRPKVLRRVLAQVPPQSRLSLLTGLVQALSDPIDDATRAVIIDAASTLPVGQTFEWSDWFMNQSQAAVLPQLATAMVRSAPNPTTPATAAALTAAAAAFRVAGDDHADATAIAAIDAIRTPPPPAELEGPNTIASQMAARQVPERGAMLKVAVAALSPAARDRMLADLKAITSAAFVAQPDRVWAALLGATLLDANGHRNESLVALRDAFAADSTDTAVVHAYADRLASDGRLAELVTTLGQRAAGNDMTMESSWAKQLVGRAMLSLYRWREVRAASENRFGPSIATDIVAQSAANDMNGLAGSLRALLIGVRGGRTTIVPEAPDPGGLQSKVDDLPDQPAAVLSSAIQWPDTPGQLIKAINVSPDSNYFSGDTGVAWVATLLARAAAADPSLCDQVMQSVGPAIATHTLNRGQRRLIAALAASPEIKLSAGWADELWPAALADESGGELQRLGRALAMSHLPHADGALRWAAVLQSTGQRVLGDASSLPSPLDSTSDLSLKVILALHSETDPAATESWLANARATGRMGGRYPFSNAIWTRLAAERGDVPAFEARLHELLSSWAWQRITPTPGFFVAGNAPKLDLRSSLPTHVTADKMRSELLDAMLRQMNALAVLWPGDTDVPRQMAAIGAWALEQGDRDAAATWFERAKALSGAQGPGEHQLWAADLARQLGRTAVATDIERTLLEQRCLPASRMASLLARLKADGPIDVVRRLAADAMTYCRAPALPLAAGD